MRVVACGVDASTGTNADGPERRLPNRHHHWNGVLLLVRRALRNADATEDAQIEHARLQLGKSALVVKLARFERDFGLFANAPAGDIRAPRDEDVPEPVTHAGLGGE